MKSAVFVMSDPKSGEEAVGRVFNATAGVEACGLPQLKEHKLAGTPGVACVRNYVAGGWQTLVF